MRNKVQVTGAFIVQSQQLNCYSIAMMRLFCKHGNINPMQNDTK